MQKHFIGKFTPDVLCTYARETFQLQKEIGGLSSPVADFLKSAVKELADLYLPGGTNLNYWAYLIESITLMEL